MEKRQEFSIVLEPNRLQKEYFKDLIRYRELFFFLAWRDIKVRYKQAALGVAWAIIRPLITMAIFALIFGYIAKMPSLSVSYPLFVLAGLLPWILFSASMIDSSVCLVNNSQLISKVYFPRVIIVSSYIMVNFVDFLIGTAVLFLFFIISGTALSWKILLFPLLTAHTLLLCLSVGLWISAMTVRYRDLRFIVQMIVQFGMFISPIGYGTFMVPEKWLWLYSLNPLVGIVDGFRWSIFDLTDPFLPYSLSVSIGITLTLFFTGFAFFRKIERSIADEI